MKHKWLILIALLSLVTSTGAASFEGIQSNRSIDSLNKNHDISTATSDCEDRSSGDDHDEDCDFPEMDVKGNSISIPDGDSTPSLSDHTDYGSVLVAGGTVSHTFAITNSGDDELRLTGTPKVVLGGPHAADFAVTVQPSSPVEEHGWTTFTVRCNPSAAGLRSVILSIENNDADENPYNFTVQCTGISDTNPHILSVTRADPDSTSLSSVDFVVTFSEPVTGVDTSAPFDDFALFTTGGISGAAVTGVVDSGDQTSYTVTVDTGTGNGTLRLDVVDNGSIEDLAGNPLTGGFTAGEEYTIVESATFGKTAPADAATGESLSPTLSWESSTGATSYEYCYSSAPGPCTEWHSVGSNTSVNLSGLAAGYTYYWQVRAVDAGGTTEADSGAWWSFTTQSTPACSWPAYTAPATPTFADVPMYVTHWDWVERLYNAGITTGCGNGNYCPLDEVVRAQTAIFLLRARHCGSGYTPPDVGDSTGFNDVPLSASYAPWVKQSAAEGIIAGCGNGNFCPGTVVNRAQMAIFLLRAKHGVPYSPPGVGGNSGFNDVPMDVDYAPWVKQLAAEGITAGCGGGNFCPLQAVNRAQMATFLVRAFGLP